MPYSETLDAAAIKSMLRERFSNPAIAVPLLAILTLAYIAEIGSYTFHADHYVQLSLRWQKYSAWFVDGRYLGELLRYVALDGYYLPTLMLLVGLALLSATGFLLAELWGVRDRAAIVLITALICTFPLFLEPFSYTALRHTVPLAVFCAVVGITVGDMRRPISAASGAMGLLFALTLYQAGIYFAAAAVLVWAATLLLRGMSVAACVAFLLSKIGLFLVAGLLYIIVALVVTAVTGYSPDRLSTLGTIPSSWEQFSFTALSHLRAMASFFTQGTFLYPLAAKALLCAAVVALLVKISFGRGRPLSTSLFALGLLIATPFAVHGVGLILFPP